MIHTHHNQSEKSLQCAIQRATITLPPPSEQCNAMPCHRMQWNAIRTLQNLRIANCVLFHLQLVTGGVEALYQTLLSEVEQEELAKAGKVALTANQTTPNQTKNKEDDKNQTKPKTRAASKDEDKNQSIPNKTKMKTKKKPPYKTILHMRYIICKYLQCSVSKKLLFSHLQM